MRSLTLSAVFLAAVALPSLTVTARPDDKPAAEGRFDTEVREDLFAGFGGDAEALARGAKTCDDALAKNPKNAEALVWHEFRPSLRDFVRTFHRYGAGCRHQAEKHGVVQPRRPPTMTFGTAKDR